MRAGGERGAKAREEERIESGNPLGRGVCACARARALAGGRAGTLRAKGSGRGGFVGWTAAASRCPPSAPTPNQMPAAWTGSPGGGRGGRRRRRTGAVEKGRLGEGGPRRPARYAGADRPARPGGSGSDGERDEEGAGTGAEPTRSGLGVSSLSPPPPRRRRRMLPALPPRQPRPPPRRGRCGGRGLLSGSAEAARPSCGGIPGRSGWRRRRRRQLSRHCHCCRGHGLWAD